MTQQTPPADQQHRDRIESGLDENLFVEAGAGTGKTTALVGRIVTLIASGRAEMHGLAAITFTEAAAAELRDRVRRDLEAAAANDDRDADSQERCRRAVAEMEAASVQTLHSFAQSLLRELPLEAGLPPGFEMLDPIEADLRFQEAWDAWLDAALDSDDLGPVFARALHLGLDLDELRRVAAAFNRDYDLVGKAPITPAPEPALTIGKDLAAAVPEIESLLLLSHNGEGDELYDHALRVLAIAEQLPGDDADAPVYERAVVRLLGARKLNTNRGRVGDWDKDAITGKNGCTLLKETLRELEERRERDIAALRTAAFTPALEAGAAVRGRAGEGPEVGWPGGVPRPAGLGAGHAPRQRRCPPPVPAPLPPHPPGRVPGHGPHPGRDSLLPGGRPGRCRVGGEHRLASHQARRGQAVHGRRSQAVHLPLPPGGHRDDGPRPRPPRQRDHALAAELPLAGRHHRLGQPRLQQMDAARGGQLPAGRLPGPHRDGIRAGGARMARASTGWAAG